MSKPKQYIFEVGDEVIIKRHMKSSPYLDDEHRRLINKQFTVTSVIKSPGGADYTLQYDSTQETEFNDSWGLLAPNPRTTQIDKIMKRLRKEVTNDR